MAELAFDTTVNYQKIRQEGSVSLSVANPSKQATSVVTHSLGYIPNVRVWFTNASGEICPASGGITDSLISGTTTDFALYRCWFRVTSTQLTLVFDRGATVAATVSSTLYYRIYYDAT